MTRRTLLCATVAVLVTAALVNAQIVPGRWEKVDSQPAGKQITIILKAGDRIDGAFRSSTAEALTVTGPGGGERTIPKSEVRKIESAEGQRDSIRNGLLIGLIAGSAVGVVTALAGKPWEEVGGDKGAWVALLAAVDGGIGAGIGALGDYATRSHEVLYQAAAR